jgi:hypothetical protein
MGWPSRLRAAAICARAWVSVPVLSNNAVPARARFCSAAPRVTSSPRRASPAAAAANAVGVASASAHGQDTTSTASVLGNQCAGAACHQYAPVAAAASSTSVMKPCARRSAASASGGRSA